MKLLERRRNLIGAFARFIRFISGKPPLTLEACVNDKSTVDYKVYGESVQDGTPTPDTPVEVESVGEKTINLFNPNEAILNGGTIDGDTIMATNIDYYLKAGIYTIAFTTVGISGVFFRKGQVSSGYFGSCTTKDNNYACATINFTEDGYLRISHFNNDGKIKDIMLVDGNRYGNMPNYEPYGKYKIPVVASGLNIFNYDEVSFTGNNQNIVCSKYDNGFTFVAGNDGSPYGNTSNISAFNLKANTKYTSRAIVTLIDNGSSAPHAAGTMGMSLILQKNITFDTTAGKVYLVNGYVKYGGNKVGTYEIITNFTTPADMTDFKYVVTRLSPNTTLIIKDLVITEGTLIEIDNYEPYQEPITTNIYLDEPLRKIGNYADYIDFENQVVVRNVKRVDIKKSYNTYSWRGKNGVYFADVLDARYARSTNALCNRNIYWTAADNQYGMWVGVDNKYLYWIGILDYLGFTTLGEFNEWLANNSTYLLYGSKIPVEEILELPQLPTFKGTTIYSVDTNIQPSNMEVTYYSKERSVS